MKLLFTDEAWDDYLYWQQNNKKMANKINKLIKEIKRHPSTGSGSPEPLKYCLSGFWSRRIDKEHRLVYKVNEDTLSVVQCRYHY